MKTGSSPRPWGTRALIHRPSRRLRFIPTPVGNTAARAARCTRPTVHPHTRGEHWLIYGFLILVSGSSPRVWGTHYYLLPLAFVRRFIPTGVGNTTKCKRFESYFAVHPHGCGEHVPLSLYALAITGSSPRVWGTH